MRPTYQEHCGVGEGGGGIQGRWVLTGGSGGGGSSGPHLALPGRVEGGISICCRKFSETGRPIVTGPPRSIECLSSDFLLVF